MSIIEEKKNISETEAKPRRIVLVIDDEVSLRKSVAEYLSEEGFRVEEASDGQEALAFLRSCTEFPNLILLDLMMPNMDGAAFRREQLQDSKLSQIPVALMTAGRQSSELLRELAPHAIIKKPFDLNLFLATVERVCV